MSKPLSPMQPIPFTERVKLVQAEVIARTAHTPANERNGHRARLWCAWIHKNVLEVPVVTDKPVRPYRVNVWEVQP